MLPSSAKTEREKSPSDTRHEGDISLWSTLVFPRSDECGLGSQWQQCVGAGGCNGLREPCIINSVTRLRRDPCTVSYPLQQRTVPRDYSLYVCARMLLLLLHRFYRASFLTLVMGLLQHSTLIMLLTPSASRTRDIPNELLTDDVFILLESIGQTVDGEE